MNHYHPEKVAGVGCLLYMLFIILLVIIISTIYHKLSAVENNYKSHLGQTFIFNKDTAKIVDYSMWNSTFTLSNGKTVNSSLVDKKH
jgi:ATP-dependent Zn protease